MGYLVLARKHRPDRFEQVVGQEAIARTLQNALRTGRVAHAYLFTGPRGVGKTSMARILARALQCERGPTPTPCGECARCRGVREGSDLDVIEIDGASNRGIENIRDLRDNVRYAPTAGRFKVYIVDEVHQITTDAFNAFLKTLEEPPEHVVFVFATTEVSKVPETIRSRCQEFEFRRVPEGRIAEHLRALCAAEGIELEKGMDVEIARRARGGLRDALSLLDQLSAFGAGVVDRAGFRELTGFLESSRIAEFFQALAEGRTAAALDWVHEALQHGAAAGDLFDQLLHHVRVLVHRSARRSDGRGEPLRPALELPGVDEAVLDRQVERWDPAHLLAALQVLSHGRRQLRDFEDSTLLLEMVALELAQLAVLPTWAEWTKAAASSGVALGAALPNETRATATISSPRAASVAADAPGGRADPRPARSAAPSASAPSLSPPASTMPVEKLWERLLSQVRQEAPSLLATLRSLRPAEIEGETLWVMASSGDEAVAIDRSRLDPIVRRVTKDLVGVQLVLRPASERRTEKKEIQRKAELDEIQRLFGGETVET